jgi:hypothetical protein
MEVAEADPDTWAVGFMDECWWSRLALPILSSWAEEGKPLRLIHKSVAKDDPEPKAISCYGLYVPQLDKETWFEVRGWKARQFHNDAIPPMEPQEARGGGQEGIAPHLGQRFLAHLQRAQEMARQA